MKEAIAVALKAFNATFAAGSVDARLEERKAMYRAGFTAAAVELKAALEECLEYFEDRYDVVDGDYGAPAPNREMQMGQMIESALGRRP